MSIWGIISKRRYRILRDMDMDKRKQDILTFEADELLEEHHRIKFRSGGDLVGEVKGAVSGWWIDRMPTEERKSPALHTFHVEFGTEKIRFDADTFEVEKFPFNENRMVFTLNSEVVASLDERYCLSWRMEDAAPF